MKKYAAPAIACGLEVLDIIAKNGEIGFNKIQELTGINANSLNRYLTTLQELEYIEKNDDSKYMPGLKLAMLNGNINIFSIIKRRAEEYLLRLEEEFGMTSLLFGVTRRNITCIDKVASPNNVSMQTVGSNIRTNICCSWGMLFLKNMSEEEIHEYMTKHFSDAYARARKELFYAAVRFTKEHGYCDDELTSKSGIRRISFPIYDASKQLVAVIAVASFASLVNDEKAKAIIKRLDEYSKLISL